MYVCLCNGVTDLDIRHAAAVGCRTLGDLTMHTGCGATCGSCLSMAAELLAEMSPSATPFDTSEPRPCLLAQAA